MCSRSVDSTRWLINESELNLESVDPKTGEIQKSEIPVFRIQVNFAGSEIRRG